MRYKDFTTITRAHTLASPTQLDTEIFEQIRNLFRRNWKKGIPIRLLGVHASHFTDEAAQIDLLDGNRQQRWKSALAAADKLRDKFGESSVGLAAGLRGSFRYVDPKHSPGGNPYLPDDRDTPVVIGQTPSPRCLPKPYRL